MYSLAASMAETNHGLDMIGHRTEVIELLAKVLNIGCIYSSKFADFLRHDIDLHTAVHEDKPVLPGFLIYPNHVSIVYDPAAKMTYLTYKDLF